MSMKDAYESDLIHERFKVLVLGDFGVGKSTLVNLMRQSNASSKPNWTIGCSIELHLHQFRQGTQSQRDYLIEMWEIGGYKSHAEARKLFYDCFHGIILVHDLTNRKSYDNLQKWLAEVLAASHGLPLKDGRTWGEFDAELFSDQNIPTIIVGTKKDLHKSSRTTKPYRSLAEGMGAFEIEVDCMDKRAFAPGLTNSAEMTRFFDKVIDKKKNSPLKKAKKPLGLLYGSKRLHYE